MNRCLAIIPARAGSKGLVNKNIKSFAGNPLIEITVRAALSSGVFTKVIVTTDSPEIINLYAGNDRVHIHKRSAVHAADHSLISDTLMEVASAEGLRPEDDFFLLQPTSPLRNVIDIETSYNLFKKGNFKCLISVSPPLNQAHDLVNISSNGKIINNGEPYIPINRQQMPTTAYINGAIYISNFGHYKEMRNFICEETGLYWMPKMRSIDIDDQEDFDICEIIWHHRRNHF